MALSCFSGMSLGIRSLLSAGGGITVFGYNPEIDSGRSTPMYDPSTLAEKVESTVNDLTSWAATQEILQGYSKILETITESAYQEEGK